MKRTLAFAAVLALVVPSAASAAQPDAPTIDDVAETTEDTTAPAPEVAEPETAAASSSTDTADGADADTASAESADGSVEEVIARAKAAKDAYDDLKEKGTTAITVGGLAAAVTWLLIAGIKFAFPLHKKTKRWLPVVAAGLGIAAAVFGKMAMGLPWAQALVAGAGPPLAVFIQEIGKFRKRAAEA